MPTIKTDLERKLFDALKRIARDYETSDRLLKHGDCGLSGEEALEYAYDNIQHEARCAIKGVRLPRAPTTGSGHG